MSICSTTIKIFIAIFTTVFFCEGYEIPCYIVHSSFIHSYSYFWNTDCNYRRCFGRKRHKSKLLPRHEYKIDIDRSI